MEEIKDLLGVIVRQLDERSERDLVAKLNQDERDATLSAVHASVEGVRDAIMEVEYKLEAIDMRLENIEKKSK